MIVDHNPAINNAIRGNSIFSNTGIGIDLGNDGVTSNDAGDLDDGANNLQNFPVFTDVRISGGGDLLATYFVDSDPSNTSFPITIEVFKADADAQEGKTMLGSDSYSVTDYANCGTSPCSKLINMGNAATLGIGADDFVVGTATDSDGNTSEFSDPIAPLPQPFLTVTKVVMNNDGGTKTVTDFLLFVDSTPVTSGDET